MEQISLVLASFFRANFIGLSLLLLHRFDKNCISVDVVNVLALKG